MKKLFSILLLFSFLFLTANISDAAVNSYDRYDNRTGSYRETSSGFNKGVENVLVLLSYTNISGLEALSSSLETTLNPVSILNLTNIFGWGIDLATEKCCRWDSEFIEFEMEEKK